MRIYSYLIALALILSACASPATATENPVPPSEPTAAPTEILPTEIVVTQDPPTETPAQPSDFFTQNNVTLPAPVCNGLTPAQTEGPYYTPNTPERNSLLEPNMAGTRLLVVGYVLDANCQPLANAWLDFWQADAQGQYDNVGYVLRGHQFTDAQGRFFLETIAPGLYESRPIEHIHVMLRSPLGAELTTQLYFPQQPIADLTVTLEEREAYLVAYFNFVLPK
jgi:protocatechuate 3,4-dioxygenase beta subunit